MKNKQNLNQLLFNHHKNTVLLPTFFMAILLFIFYFSSNTYIYNFIKSKVIEDIKAHGENILLSESKYINSSLNNIAHLSKMLQKEHEHFFANPSINYLPYGTPTFELAHNGVYYKANKEGSSLYYSSAVKMTKVEKDKAMRSETMDVSFKNIVDNNPNIIAAYFNSWDNMNRLYPYIDKVYDQYGKSINMYDHNFYYLADAKHNPEKQPVWTDAYLDPAGNGWMISCVVPIYNNGFLEGVSGIDIRIENFVKSMLQGKLAWDGGLFLVDEVGGILAMPKKIEEILKIKELYNHKYTQQISKTTAKPLEYNLLKNENSPFGEEFKKHYHDKTDVFELEVNSVNYLLLQTTIEATGWRLLLIIEKSTIFHSVYQLKKYADIIGYSAIVLAIIFYISFLLYTVRRSKILALEITNPIQTLSKETTYIGTDKVSKPLKQSNIEEIEQLNVNFAKMTHELKTGKRNLMRTKEIAHKYHEKSIKDPLTGLYNRNKLDGVMNHEINLAQKNNQNFSMIMLDIDFFKTINDTFGHAVGDKILISFSNIIKKNTRETDVVVRNGGDEFLVICLNTTAKEAFVIAQNLCMYIEDDEYHKEHKVTASIGVSSYQSDDAKEDIFIRADKALYIAKEKGRNRVESL